MAVTSALVVYACLWFLCLFCVMPFRTRTQGDAGEVVPGTPKSAPAQEQMGRTFAITSVIAFVLWIPLCAAIIYGYISADTMNLYKRFGPDS
ncbi:putative secreted protein [Litoreibacter ponti]|uniref:Putative secreted protein n=1 Tax=Litoreibacter ponti TaxID=1510457 RepID=A0A2T6BM31_9RHOB|nr:DUF1467 family protein [Litoreibacter ponti]PTX57047.1 putative secreted protein [Litoreibacter ponti]